MPISRDWDDELRAWVMTSGESCSLDEIVDLAEKHEWGPARRYLWDLRDLREGPGSTEELRDAVGVVERGRAIWQGGRSAILVDRDVDFGIARMFQAFAENLGVEFQVFRDRAAAAAWLAELPDETAG